MRIHIVRQSIRVILSLMALGMSGVQAGEISASIPNPLTSTFTVGSADYFQPVGLTLNINGGGKLVIGAAQWETIIQQNVNGTTVININTNGILDCSNAGGRGVSFYLGNNRTAATGIINLNGGTFDGSGLTDIVFGRAGALGTVNIAAGTVIFGVQPVFTKGGINFTSGSSGFLTISGGNRAYFEGLFTAGKLTHNGVNTGAFTNHFHVSGETVALLNVAFPTIPPIAIDPLNKRVILSWPSTPEVLYDIEGSEDLGYWWSPPLASEVPPTGAITSWVDKASNVTTGRRFYRILERPPGRAGLTTFDGDGSLNLDRTAWLARNNLVYQSPPTAKTDSIPLGSGKVGAALWIDPTNGLTAHLNRPEGVPAMAGLGTLCIPQLAGISSATNYEGILSIGEGIFTQKADGLTVTAFFRWGGEELVIDVQGANPSGPVTARLGIYSGGSGHGGTVSLTPTYAIASDIPGNEATGTNCIAIAGGNGTTARYPGFRATQFAAARAVGRDIVATCSTNEASLTFKPNPDGSYRVVVPLKLWTGSPAGLTTLKPEALAAVAAVSGLATNPLAGVVGTQSAAFRSLWDGTSLIRLTASNSAARKEARFIEQMLALDTYFRLSASLTPLPATGGGETRLFCWNAAGLFNLNHWYQNLRPINHANIASGVWNGNAGTWNWHLQWLPQLQQHVSSKFPGYEGAGYPEYVDGQPGTGGSFLLSQNWGTWNIATSGTRWYTSRMMSTTLEVVSAILSEYDYRQDTNFLGTYWPLIREGMLFHRSLLMEGGPGTDALYHYKNVNSRENNWDDDDDTPDVANMRYLLPAVINLAGQRGDTNLAAKLNDLVGRLPELPTEIRTNSSGIPVTAIAYSALSRSSGHNAENPDLDAIWPANYIGDASGTNLVQLANNTLDTRRYKENYDWHPTSIQAARMGRADLYKSALLNGISRFLSHPQGFGAYDGGNVDVQTEFTAVQTLGAHEALVQNYDGLLRLANAWPGDWEAIAWLPAERGHRVGLEVVGGICQVAVVDLGSGDPAMRIRNPWPGETFSIRDLTSGAPLHSGNQNIATVAAVAGHRLLIERASRTLASFSFKPVADSPNSGPNVLGGRRLGKQ